MPERLIDGRLAEFPRITDFETASKSIEALRRSGHFVALATGVFDILHAGHVAFFQEIREKIGDGYLFVGLENDKAVKLNKGLGRPNNALEDRLRVLSSLQEINRVFGFADEPHYGRDSGVFFKRNRVLHPDTIAVSIFDPNIELKRQQALRAGISVLGIEAYEPTSSTGLAGMVGAIEMPTSPRVLRVEGNSGEIKIA